MTVTSLRTYDGKISQFAFAKLKSAGIIASVVRINDELKSLLFLRRRGRKLDAKKSAARKADFKGVVGRVHGFHEIQF